MKSLKFPAAALVLGMVLSANTCSENTSGTTRRSASGKWELVSLYGQTVQLPSGSQQPYLNFDSLLENVNGFAGCNRIFGSMAVHGDSLAFPGLAATKMYCQQTQQVEDRFLKALNATRTFTVKGDELVLKDSQELAVLRRGK
jgi:heat shock protein HslJ